MLAASSWQDTLTCRRFPPCTVRTLKSFAFRIRAGTLKGTKMLSKNLAIAIAVVLACICLAEARDESPHDMADALRMLQELDRFYTQAARPRIDRRDVGDERVDPQLIDRALRLLQLQTLDRLYSYHTRPRFGKRSDAISNWAKDLEKPDIPAWLQYARRR